MTLEARDALDVLVSARVGVGKFEYRGFLIRYTGLKVGNSDTVLSAQWLANSLHDRRLKFYCDTSGSGGTYESGQSFDIRGPDPVTSDDPPEKVVMAVVAAKLKLLSMVDQHCGVYRGSPSASSAWGVQ